MSKLISGRGYIEAARDYARACLREELLTADCLPAALAAAICRHLGAGGHGRLLWRAAQCTRPATGR